MKKELILIVLLMGVVSAIPSITFPNDNYQNINNYNVEWVGGEGCNLLEESVGSPDSFIGVYADSGSSFSKSGVDDNTYYYRVRSKPEICSEEGNWSDWSTTKFIIVDTTFPTVISKSPTGINENKTGIVSVTFDETMNTSVDTLSGPFLTGEESWSNGDKTVTQSYSGNEGITTYYNISGTDLAGNTINEQIVFKTGVSPKTVTINTPIDGSSHSEGNSIEITATVTGGPSDSDPCLGATVVASGACEATLTEGVDGVYSGTCTLSDYNLPGEPLTGLTITATKGDDSASDSILLDIEKSVGLAITVSKPTNFDLLRGEDVLIRVYVSSDEEGDDTSVAVADATVTAPGMSFVSKTGGYYEGTFSSSYSTGGSALTFDLPITASAIRNSVTKSTNKEITFNMIPVDLAVESVFLQNDEETTLATSGKLISIKTSASYPDGTPATGTVSGTFEVSSTATQSDPISLTFTKSGNYYITESIHTSGDFDSAYTASITFTDANGNTGTSDYSILGPAKGLKFEPEAELIFSPGQEVEIAGKVYSELEQKYLTTAQIEFENKTYTYSSSKGYVIPYVVSQDITSGSKTLNLLIKGSSLDYPYPLVITISKNLKIEVPQTIERGKPVKVQIKYPNGEPVTEGNFSITALGETYELTKDEENYWVANVDLGDVDTTYSLSLLGTDAFGNRLTEEQEVTYTVSAFEKAKANPLQVVFILIGAVFLLGVFFYVRSYTRIKASLTVTKADLIKRYKHLLLEKEKINYLKKKIRVDVMQRRISQEDMKAFERESVQRSNDILANISEMESKYDYIRQEKERYEQEALKEIEKIRPYLKQNIKEETEVTKAMVSIKKQVDYGADISEIKSKIINKYSESGKKAIRRAEIEGLLKKKAKAKEIAIDPVQETKKLMRSGEPEQAIKKSLMNQGKTESEAVDIINKAKRL